MSLFFLNLLLSACLQNVYVRVLIYIPNGKQERVGQSITAKGRLRGQSFQSPALELNRYGPMGGFSQGLNMSTVLTEA